MMTQNLNKIYWEMLVPMNTGDDSEKKTLNVIHLKKDLYNSYMKFWELTFLSPQMSKDNTLRKESIQNDIFMKTMIICLQYPNEKVCKIGIDNLFSCTDDDDFKLNHISPSKLTKILK